MSTNKDYYQILGIPKNATDEQIKQAYRKLAREHHPDMVKDGDKAKAEERFKEINEAYQILSNPQKRKMYDQFGHTGPGFAGGQPGAGGFGGFSQGTQGGSWGPFSYSYTSSNGGQGFEDFDPFDVFEDFFGFRGFGGSRSPKRGKNLYYEMDISFADAVHGIVKNVKIESGEISVKVPAGTYDGLEMRFAGKGLAGPQGTPAGDLFITFRVKIPREFQKFGDAFGVALEIDFARAVLGGVVDVPVVDPSAVTGIGKAQLNIPSGTQHGTQFRLREKGMPHVGRNNRGDIIVQVFVTIPKKLNRRQRELLEEYRRVS